VVTVYAVDIGTAVNFCGQILDLEETCRVALQGDPEHIEFRIGFTTLALSSLPGLAVYGLPAASPGHPFELGLQTDDVDGLIAELRDKGVTVLKAPRATASLASPTLMGTGYLSTRT
jgi:hypothetical protein